MWSGVTRDGEHVNPPVEWTLVQCKECRMPSLQLREGLRAGFRRRRTDICVPGPPPSQPGDPRGAAPRVGRSEGLLRCQGLLGLRGDGPENQGAHYTGESVSRDDAEDSLAFTEALLDHVYVLRKRFEEFQKRLDR